MLRSEITKQDKLNPRGQVFSVEFNCGQNKKDMFRVT